MNPSNKLCFSEQFSHSWNTNKVIYTSSYSIGDVVSLTETYNPSMCYMSFKVKAGDTVQLKIEGGSLPRAYALLDSNDRLLEMADAGASIDKTLTIANDGTLIVNNNSSSPILVHKGVREPSAIYLNGYAKRVHIGADKVWIHKDEPMYIGANQEMSWSATNTNKIITGENVGTVISFTPEYAAGYIYTIASVKKGDVLLVTAKGHSDARPWALLDNSRRLISKGDAGVQYTNYPLTATADGYLVCNDYTGNHICKRVNPHKYDTVKIGNQVWMATNLDENLGLLLSNQWYYDNDKATYGAYGRLYTWDNLNTNLSAILPSGWRLPTATDISTLATTCGGTSVAGKVLKVEDANGTDEQNFGLLLGGQYNSGSFQNVGTNGSFLSVNGTTPNYNTVANAADGLSTSTAESTDGYNVRLVKDAVSLTSVASPTSASSDDESDTTEETAE